VNDSTMPHDDVVSNFKVLPSMDYHVVFDDRSVANLNGREIAADNSTGPDSGLLTEYHRTH
jgi:hypothetical protein